MWRTAIEAKGRTSGRHKRRFAALDEGVKMNLMNCGLLCMEGNRNRDPAGKLGLATQCADYMKSMATKLSGGIRPSREQLVETIKAARMQAMQVEASQTSQLRNSASDAAAAPACAAAVSQLRTVALCGLKVGTPARGQVLHGTLIVDSCRPTTALAAAIECEACGESVWLSIYDDEKVERSLYDVTTEVTVSAPGSQDAVARRFPKGLRLSIKEPYLKVFASGMVGLRVDHPGNVVIGDERGRGADSAGATASEHKAAGNAHFKAGRHKEALLCWASALDCEDADDAMRVALLSNSAAASLALDDPDGARERCEAALLLDSSHVKVRYRLCDALTRLGLHRDAVAEVERLIECAPTDVAAADMRARVLRCAAEAADMD